MTGVDDGIVNGNLTLADVLFLIAAILAVIECVLIISKRGAMGWLTPLAIALVAFGWLVL